MIAGWVIAMTVACTSSTQADTAVSKAAVFPFEFDDTSLQGEIKGHDGADLLRLTRLDGQLRDAFDGSGRYIVLPAVDGGGNISPRICNGCETALARRMHADVTVFGWIQKVSNLILNINLVVRDVASGQPIRSGSVDIRGNTDESWTRGLNYLLRHRILVDDSKP